MGELMTAQMPKFIEFAQANPGDDAAFNALIFVVQNTSGASPNEEYNRAIEPFAEQSLSMLLDKYEEKLASRPQVLEPLGPRGEKALRGLRAKLKQGDGYWKVTASLANLLKSPTERADSDEAVAKAQPQAKEAEVLYAEIVEKAGDQAGLRRLVAEAKANLEELRTLGIGKTMPELEGKDLDDQPVKLSDYRGKVVVLDVWATWCGPCRAMIPHERELVERLAGKPFALISVSCDEKKETLTEFLEKEKMPWVHWWDGKSGPVAKALNLRYYPTIYVLDANGVIRYRGPRGAKMDAAVDKLLKERAAS
jgi:thiol-disulfide isomerase/thioredoxin